MLPARPWNRSVRRLRPWLRLPRTSGSVSGSGELPPPGDLPYLAVREKLRALGYLDGPLDRFFLGSVARPRSPLRSAAATSLRVGALGCPLLGFGLAAGAAPGGRPRRAKARGVAPLSPSPIRP